MERITPEQYEEAKKSLNEAQELINKYHIQKGEDFKKRLESGEPFTDDELIYSRYTRCPCGAGLAYPKDCSPGHYWDCAAILNGTAEHGKQHTAQLPFNTYDVKGELYNGPEGSPTTRPKE